MYRESPIDEEGTRAVQAQGVGPETATRVEVGCSFQLEVAAPTVVFGRIRPCDHVTTGDPLVITNAVGSTVATTSFDWVPGTNGSAQFVETLTIPPGRSLASYRALVEVSSIPDAMPDDASAPRVDQLTPSQWWWLQPSRYCRPDELGEEAWIRFGSGVTAERPATGRLVREICSYVNANMTFAYGSSTPSTTATHAWAARRGVCRDFNHIAVSFCRALNIPARYAFGYLPDIGVPLSDTPMDFCAWFEVFLDGAWWTFDARVNEPRIGRIVIARGRDAADVPLIATMGPAVTSEFYVVARASPDRTAR